MPRKPSAEPSWKEDSGQYVCYIDRKKVYLGADKKAAKIKMLQLRLAAEQDDPAKPVPAPRVEDLTFVDLCAKYLKDHQAKRKPGTGRSLRERFTRAIVIIGADTPARSIRKSHLSLIESTMSNGRLDFAGSLHKDKQLDKPYSPTTIKDTIQAVIQAFAWAADVAGLVPSNPLIGYPLPAGRGRTRVATQDEHMALLRTCTHNPWFRLVLVASRRSGCRPGELRMLKWDMVDLDAGLWVIPTSEHKTGTLQRQPRPRVIPLPPSLVHMCRLLKARSQSEFVFTDRYGHQYSKNTLVIAFRRARERAKIPLKAGEALVLYSNRHAFGTRSVGKVTDLELANVMGHTSTRTVAKYVHMDTAQMKAIRDKIGD